MTDHSNELKEVNKLISRKPIFIRLLILIAVIVAGVTVVLSTKGKAKHCEDCTPYKSIAESLLEALKKSPTVYEPVQSGFQFASYYDTIKPMSVKQWTKYKDSVIAATQKKLDSLKKTKT